MKRLIIILLSINFSFASAASKDFPVPPKTQLQAITDSTNYEGMTLKIRRFDVNLTIEQVLNFYRKEWQDEYVENDVPPWKMISTKQGDEFLTVQIQTSGFKQSWGYLGTSDLPAFLESGRMLGENKQFFPMMRGSKIINDMLNDDIGKQSRVLLINNNFSVNGNAQYYRDHYVGNGWTNIIDQSGGNTLSHVLVFQRGSQSVSMSINPAPAKVGGATNIVVNAVY